MLRQVRLQVSGIGALTAEQSVPAAPAEQSKNPCPALGITHEGAGGSPMQSPFASEYVVPEGQVPASSKGLPKQP
jgi:hypothetical protein